jgi:hypothetical protein
MKMMAIMWEVRMKTQKKPLKRRIVAKDGEGPARNV